MTGFRLQILARPDDFEQLASTLAQRHGRAGRAQVERLDAAYRAFAEAAAAGTPEAQEALLRRSVAAYFDRPLPQQPAGEEVLGDLPLTSAGPDVGMDARALIAEAQRRGKVCLQTDKLPCPLTPGGQQQHHAAELPTIVSSYCLRCMQFSMYVLSFA